MLFPHKVEKEAKRSPPKVLANAIRKGSKNYADWKERKLSVDDMIVYLQVSKELTGKLLELISNYSKVGR